MKIASIIIKDLKAVLSDKQALAIMILMPMILMTILSFALKGSFATGEYDMDSVNIAVVKLYDAKNDSEMFEESLRDGLFSKSIGEETLDDMISSSGDADPEKIFFEDFLGSREVSRLVSYTVVDESRAMELLKSGEISAAVILPERFVYSMKYNLLTPFRNNVDLKVLVNPDRNIDGQVVNAVMKAYTDVISSVIIGKNVLIEEAMANGVSDLKDIDDAVEKITSAMDEIEVNTADVAVEGKRSIKSADYYASAMMTMFILFAAGNGGRMLLEEKDNRTYQRMAVAGTDRFGILAGKFAVIFIIASVQIAVMILFSGFALKVYWGDLRATALVSAASSMAVAGLGSFVAAFTFKSGNYKMANAFDSVIIQVMALLGGSFFPLDVMPEAMQKLSFLSLNGIALKSYLKIMMGYGIQEIYVNVAILSAVGAVLLAAAVMLLSGKEAVKC